MKKIATFILITSILSSCKKDELKDIDNSQPPTPSTISVSYSGFVYQLYYCRFTYYDVNGGYHLNQNETDRTIENVDFSRPFKVEAQVGISMYDPSSGWIENPQTTDWQTKKDGVVMDAKSATNYVYQN